MYIVYQTTDLKNGRIYIGVHKQNNLEDDGYRGSNIHIKRIKKREPERLLREILYSFENEEEAYEKEKEIINESFLKRSDVYNITLGGSGSFSHIDNFGENNPNWKGKTQKPHSEEHLKNLKIRMSGESNPMKNEDILNKHFRGRKRPEHSLWMKNNFIRGEDWKKKISNSKKKHCVINGISFSSHNDAAIYFSVSVGSITRWLKEGVPKRIKDGRY